MKLYTLNNQFIEETDTFPDNFTGFVEYTMGIKYGYLNGKFIGSGQQHKLLVDTMKLKGLL